MIGGGASVMYVGNGNFISGNGRNGISIYGPNTTLNDVANNQIGSYASSLTTHGNGNDGIVVALGASRNLIGGFSAWSGNTIAYNKHTGVVIGVNPTDTTTVGDEILSNSIHNNGGLGIDLGNNGVSQVNPGPGPNNFLAMPVITKASSNGTTTTVTFEFTGAVASPYLIQFCYSTSPDPSGFGEGQNFIPMNVPITTDGTGHYSVTMTLPVQGLSGLYLSATATDASGDTSEFSNAFQIQ